MERITIPHIDRIEGKAGFIGNILDGAVSKAKIEILQATRLIEGILIGRYFKEAPLITARICGLCPVVHNLTAIKALETALNIEVSEQIILLRKLMLYGQIIHSHALHLFFLSLPDFFDLEKEIELIKKYPKETKEALLIRDFGNELIEIIGGRSIHPINSEVGGFKKEINKKELRNLLKNYEKVFTAGLNLLHLFKKLRYPNFERKTNFISLYTPEEYAIYEGGIKKSEVRSQKSKVEIISVRRFIHDIEEIEEPYKVVKKTKYEGESFMVGALARVNNNYKQLNKEAKKNFQFLISNIQMPICNPFYNIFAQAIEIVHFLEESEKLIKEYLKIKNPKLKVKSLKPAVSPLRAVGAAEAPRGTLYHYYELDREGYIRNCNIITPTAQNLNNLEEDLKVFLPNLRKVEKEERRNRIRMLIRAYDPCITCATH